MSYNENLLQWVEAQTILLREANEKARKASNYWNVLNEEFKVWCKASNLIDIVEITKVKEKNIPLKAAMDKWSFWEREAKRIASYIEAEISLRKLSAYAKQRIGVDQL